MSELLITGAASEHRTDEEDADEDEKDSPGGDMSDETLLFFCFLFLLPALIFLPLAQFLLDFSGMRPSLRSI